MINNNNDITEYTNYNKIYIPNNYNNQNYSYRINGDNILIITNNNCYTNYNTTYCDCNTYNYKNNVVSETYACNTNNNNPTIAYTSITSDINYSEHIRNIFIQDKGILLIIIIVGLLFAKLLLTERSSY